MAKLKIITAYDDNYKQIGDLSAKSIRLYAACHGYDYEIFPLAPIDRPPAWQKVKLVKDELAKGEHEFVMWVDADACFVRGDRDIADELDADKDFFIVKYIINERPLAKGVFWGIERPNTGVFVARRGDYCLRLLDEVWAKDKYCQHPWWEQAALMDIIGYRVELTNDVNANNFDNPWTEKIKWLPLEWNSWDRWKPECIGEVFDPVIIHYPGRPQDFRIEHMSKLEFRASLGRRKT